MARFRADDLVVETKPDLTPVSEADRDVEQALRERLAAVRPEDSVVGEEYGSRRAAARPARRWIVDPIDGTKSYVRGVPVWATLLALEVDGELTVGRGLGAGAGTALVGGPRRRARSCATARDRSRAALRVSGVRELDDAQLCFGGLDGWREVGRLDGLLELSERCWRTRGYGDFWQYMLVAEGAVEIALDPEVSLWDLAAPLVDGARGRRPLHRHGRRGHRRRRRRDRHQRVGARRRAWLHRPVATRPPRRGLLRMSGRILM